MMPRIKMLIIGIILVNIMIVMTFIVINKQENAKAEKCSRLWIRKDGNSYDGYGYHIYRLKSNIIMSQYVGFRMVIEDVKINYHDYYVSELVNTVKANVITFAKDNKQISTIDKELCIITDNDCNGNCERFAQKICTARRTGVYDRELIDFKKKMGTCRTVLDETSQVQHYWIDNDCIIEWIRKAFKYAVKTDKKQKQDTIEIAINVRWGDRAVKDLNATDVRTIKLEQVNKGIENIKRDIKVYKDLKIKLYMKNYDSRLENIFKFKYEVIDSGNDIRDMLEYSRADYTIQSGASWAILANCISDKKQIVYTTEPSNNKYKNMNNTIIIIRNIS